VIEMPESTKLPVEFSDLQDLADLFAISDDLKRSERTEAASIVERRRLVDTVWPRFAAINGYLDSHDDDSAHLLGRLAEAACEVAIEIGRSAASQ
jgi:hypothetical protein